MPGTAAGVDAGQSRTTGAAHHRAARADFLREIGIACAARAGSPCPPRDFRNVDAAPVF
jgi:hypothetical protein